MRKWYLFSTEPQKQLEDIKPRVQLDDTETKTQVEHAVLLTHVDDDKLDSPLKGEIIPRNEVAVEQLA